MPTISVSVYIMQAAAASIYSSRLPNIFVSLLCIPGQVGGAVLPQDPFLSLQVHGYIQSGSVYSAPSWFRLLVACLLQSVAGDLAEKLSCLDQHVIIEIKSRIVQRIIRRTLHARTVECKRARNLLQKCTEVLRTGEGIRVSEYIARTEYLACALDQMLYAVGIVDRRRELMRICELTARAVCCACVLTDGTHPVLYQCLHLLAERPRVSRDHYIARDRIVCSVRVKLCTGRYHWLQGICVARNYALYPQYDLCRRDERVIHIVRRRGMTSKAMYPDRKVVLT